MISPVDPRSCYRLQSLELCVVAVQVEQWEIQRTVAIVERVEMLCFVPGKQFRRSYVEAAEDEPLELDGTALG